MKKRTIEDIYDKEIGHSKFATFLNYALKDGYKIENIKEFNTNYKFLMNGFHMAFDKLPSINAKWQYEQCCVLLKRYETLKKLKGGD